MYALTVKQPWAEAIARHGKTVENRSRRPPAHLLGQRIAIHVGQAADAWIDAHAAGIRSLDLQDAHLRPLLDWAIDPRAGQVPRRDLVHGAGRIIATARLAGWVASDGSAAWAPGILGINARESPWFTGPVGWVLADVRVLQQPVGAGGSCGAERGIRGGHNVCERCGRLLLEHQPIRGQPYPFKLSAEVETAILAQEET